MSEKAGIEVHFWDDSMDMINRIEVEIWNEYNDNKYESNSVFISKEEAMDLVNKLTAAIQDLDEYEATNIP